MFALDVFGNRTVQKSKILNLKNCGIHRFTAVSPTPLASRVDLIDHGPPFYELVRWNLQFTRFIFTGIYI